MGGGLLQKVNRDTLSLATKLSHIVYADGTGAGVWARAPVLAPVAAAEEGTFAVAAALPCRTRQHLRIFPAPPLLSPPPKPTSATPSAIHCLPQWWTQ